MLTFVAGLPAGTSNSKAPGDFASVMMVSPGFLLSPDRSRRQPPSGFDLSVKKRTNERRLFYPHCPLPSANRQQHGGMEDSRVFERS
jgi:hypothetical protein